MPDIEAIYELYFDDVFRFLRALSADEHLAEELTQETFFKALSALPRFRGDCDVRVWLCQIARNSYYSHLKKQEKYSDMPLENHPDTTPGLEHLLVDKELAFAIHRVLHDLDEPYKEVFSLRVFGELSFKKIGILFGKTEHWACVTYHRAKQKIQQRMEDCHET